MAAKLRSGGRFLASTRDDDHLTRERPRGEWPRIYDDAGGRRITFQVWGWQDDGRGYLLQQFIARQVGDAWRTDCFTTHYRALLRSELEPALREAGLSDIAWCEPEERGIFQPLVAVGKH